MNLTERPLQARERIVIHRSLHPVTKEPGFAGFVEDQVCIYLHWHRTYLGASKEARQVARRM